jgi:hypothetical protein
MSDGQPRDPVSFRKDEGQQPGEFDPYRFGAPEHPVPPEYAPPGYRPPPATQPQPTQWSNPGAPPPPYYSQYPQPRTGNGKAIAALVLGILSIVLCWLSVFDAIPVVLALIFGFLGRGEARRDPARGGHGMATAGIACALVGALIAALFTAWAIRKVGPCLDYNVSSADYRTCVQQRI